MSRTITAERTLRNIVRLRAVSGSLEDGSRPLQAALDDLRSDAGETVPKIAAARLLGVSANTLDKWIARGRIAVVRAPSGRYQVVRSHLEEIAEEVERLRQDGAQEQGILPLALERLAAHKHRQLIESVTKAVGDEPRIEFAVLFGSVARGEERDDSDVDLIVRLPGQYGRYPERYQIAAKLSERVGRHLELVRLERAEEDAPLLDGALAEGKVLVDRGGIWPGIEARRSEIGARAEAVRARNMARARRALDRVTQSVS
jgi:predicted nucleotidyltransferase